MENIDQLLLEVGGLDAILLRAEVARSEIAAVAAEGRSLKEQFMDLDVGGIDRATRTILLRIPLLNEVIRLQGIIWRTQRALKLEGGRGPLTAALTIALSLWGLYQKLQRDQKRLEARIDKLEADTDLRTISLEEALRGYGELPQRYRSGVPPS